MRRKFFRTIRSARYYGIVTACSWGLFTITAMICVCGLGMTRFDIPEYAVFAALCSGLAMGGYISGRILGKINRRKGILSGIKCGAVLFVAVTVFGIIYMKKIDILVSVRDLMILMLSSAAGGISGVNSKEYSPPY